MAYCPECGHGVDPDYNVCPNCGQSLPNLDGNQSEAGETSAHESSATKSSGVGWPRGRQVTLGGAVLAMVAALLPWLNVAFVNFSILGIDGDGKFTIILALVVGAGTLAGWGSLARSGSGVGGMLILLIGLLYLWSPLAGVDVQAGMSQRQMATAVRPGIGLYGTVFGGLGIVAGAMYDTFANTGWKPRDSEHIMTDGEPLLDRQEAEIATLVEEPSQHDAIEALLEAVPPGQTVTRRSLKQDVYPEYPAGYGSADAWWSKFAKPILQEHDAIEARDTQGIRWQREER